jgi:hypothetical protein
VFIAVAFLTAVENEAKGIDFMNVTEENLPNEWEVDRNAVG